MGTLIQKNSFFLVLFCLFLVLGAYWMVAYTPVSLLLWVNDHMVTSLDVVFVFLTYVGDGLAYGVLILWLSWRSVRKAIQALLIFGVVSLTAQVLKNLVFIHSPRPMAYFQLHGLDLSHVRLVRGVPLLMAHSFPSGHSATGFSLALLVSIWLPKGYALPCFLLGLGIAYSRMYLFEHFFVDIYAGGVIGIGLTLIGYRYLEQAEWLHKKWADQGLRDHFRLNKPS